METNKIQGEAECLKFFDEADHDYYVGDEAEQLTPEDLQRMAAAAQKK